LPSFIANYPRRYEMYIGVGTVVLIILILILLRVFGII
jgi:hypothetical protein